MDIVHLPVMVEEVLQYLKPDQTKDMLLVDCTLGEGGHSERFLQNFPLLSVCGIDADANIQAKAKARLAPFGERMRFFNMWYDDFFSSYPLERKADRILFDLGISVFHYMESGRGFSFSKDESLDMRLSESAGESVAAFLSHCGEEELANILFQLGEERYSRRIARAIIGARKERGAAVFKTLGSADLAELIWNAVPADYRHGRLHPATRSFQALRIHANGELDRIQRALGAAFECLAPGGLMAVISFHSLEDRIVKTTFRELAKDCRCPPEQPRCTCGRKAMAQLLTKKPLVPTENEIATNPPSRSAKLRVVEKRFEVPAE